MGLKDFTREDSIFNDESVLRDTYQPDTLIERDSQLADYQNALRPVINNAPPKNIFVYGQTGVGKTLSTDLVLEKLTQDAATYDDLSIEIVNVICKSLSSSYQVSIRLVNELRSPENQIALRGHGSGDVYDMLWTELNQLDATHVLFVLDEIDSIGTDDDILYELPRCNANGNVDDTYVGVIGISNNFQFRDNLSARVKDSLCDEEIHFPPYDAEQLRHILETRAQPAFRDDVLTDDIIPLCAAFAAQESGSARRALRILYKAGDLARQADRSTVTEADVREADRVVEEGKTKAELESLPVQNHITLYAILSYAFEGETPVRRKQVYQRYKLFAEQIDADVKTARTIHDQLSQLTLKGILDVSERNEGIKGGNYYLYDFNVDTAVIRDALEKQHRIGDLFETNR